MDVSIVVLTWEDFERTTACVKSLPTEAEIVVVDNGSAASVSERLREMCAATGAAYVRSDTNLGYAKGMNLGVRNSSRANVILANNDVIAEPGAVARLVAELDDPAVGAAFPHVRDHDGEAGTDAGRFLSLPIGLAHLTGLSLVAPGLRISTTPERADWLSGPFVAIRRHTLDEIGGVDESAHFYSEDLRLCWSLRRSGLRLAYLPDAVITHENDSSASRRWSEEEIALRKTREFIRASREQGGWRRRAACRAYAYGAVLRSAVGRNSIRRAIARGALEGLTPR
jgi:N-acetylglucosaminyl-diphospho-decaprenol L-rhamnosyltransferase